MFEEGTFAAVVQALLEDVVSGRCPWSMWKRVTLAAEVRVMHEGVRAVIKREVRTLHE